MAASQRMEEDIGQNPFICVLRKNFEGMYKRAAERADTTTIIVPCAECIQNGDLFTQQFTEAHILRAGYVPGTYMNLLGQGVEIKDTAVCTQLGFNDPRSCTILQTESMYEFSNTFRVLITDKPLVGKYKPLVAAVDRLRDPNSAGNVPPGGGAGGPATQNASSADRGDQAGPIDWLNSAPSIQGDLFEQVDRFRKTFRQVAGCEQSTNERIRELASDATKRLIRHHNLSQPAQQRQLAYQVSRNVYAALHSFIFPHLQRILADADVSLHKAIKSYGSSAAVMDAMPDMNRDLALLDISGCCDQLAGLDHLITPHEKVDCINDTYTALQRCVTEGVRASARKQQEAIEITGDDVISLFVLAVHGSSLQHRLAHVAHMEMYIQGAAGRCGDSAIGEAGYAFSAFQAGLQFFLKDQSGHSSVVAEPRRPAARPAPATTSVFSKALGAQPQPGDSNDSSLQSLMRSARTQGAGGYPSPSYR